MEDSISVYGVPLPISGSNLAKLVSPFLPAHSPYNSEDEFYSDEKLMRDDEYAERLQYGGLTKEEYEDKIYFGIEPESNYYDKPKNSNKKAKIDWTSEDKPMIEYKGVPRPPRETKFELANKTKEEILLQARHKLQKVKQGKSPNLSTLERQALEEERHKELKMLKELGQKELGSKGVPKRKYDEVIKASGMHQNKSSQGAFKKGAADRIVKENWAAQNLPYPYNIMKDSALQGFFYLA